jgi:hypothetical protein
MPWAGSSALLVRGFPRPIDYITSMSKDEFQEAHVLFLNEKKKTQYVLDDVTQSTSVSTYSNDLHNSVAAVCKVTAPINGSPGCVLRTCVHKVRSPGLNIAHQWA